MALAEDERRDLLAFLRTLSIEDWGAPSLCAEWTVAQVATHVVSYDEIGTARLATLFARGAGSVSKVNNLALARYEPLTPEGTLGLIERTLRPRGLTAGLGGGIALTDGMIHHQDIRRALGRPRRIPAERIVPVLDFALRAPTIPAKKNAKGLRLSTTDASWERGTGETVEGPAEAILMSLAGRSEALADLSGPGLTTLSARLEER
jgi:uncharacterized protein (TIGR03083 family)